MNCCHNYLSRLYRLMYNYCVQVLQVVKKCSCGTNALNAVHHGNGKFIITGGRIRDKKTLHARVSIWYIVSSLYIIIITFLSSVTQLLSDRIMVRVGGGWDTLDRFLFEHDPCRIQQILLRKLLNASHDIQSVYLWMMEHTVVIIHLSRVCSVL